jgi:transposase, IS5 family
MIIDRYERPVDRVEPTVSDPILHELDGILDDPQLFALVQRDLRRHYRPLPYGRRSVPVEVILRLTVLRRVKRWSYRQTEQEVRDSQPYRWWARVYDQRVPDHSTLNDLERQIEPQTLHRLNDRVLRVARDAHLTQGDRLRVDSSVTESNIHYPTDSSLLVDGVRILSRHLERAKPFLTGHLRDLRLYSNHTRSARRRARRIGQLSRPGKAEEQRTRGAEAKKSPTASVHRTDYHCPNQCGASPPSAPSARASARRWGAAASTGCGLLSTLGRTGDRTSRAACVLQPITPRPRESGQPL